MPEQSCRLAAQSPRALPAIPVWRTWCNQGAVPCQISCIFLPSRASTSAPGDGDAALSLGSRLRLFIAGGREFVQGWSFAACATWLNRRPKASRPLGWPGWEKQLRVTSTRPQPSGPAPSRAACALRARGDDGHDLRECLAARACARSICGRATQSCAHSNRTKTKEESSMVHP